jgi:hypothetical protein
MEVVLDKLVVLVAQVVVVAGVAVLALVVLELQGKDNQAVQQLQAQAEVAAEKQTLEVTQMVQMVVMLVMALLLRYRVHQLLMLVAAAVLQIHEAVIVMD